MNLEIRALRKTFDDQVVLNDINLKLEGVHSLAIIGPSGVEKLLYCEPWRGF